jgi:hypothetical protein
MSKQIEVFVESDFVGNIKIGDELLEKFSPLLDAIGQSASIVDITGENLPVIGMKYSEQKFKETSKLKFEVNAYPSNIKVFGFLVDSTLVAIQILISPQMDNLIAAFLSNPSLRVTDV